MVAEFAPSPVPARLPGSTAAVAETRHSWQQGFLLVAPALLAAALALLVHALGLRGTDEAAQTYRVSEVRVYGPVLWDSGWYGGNLPLGYSVMFPLLGAITGLMAAGAVAAAAATFAFDRLVVAAWGRRGPAAWYMAIATVLPVSIGQLPYLSGEALGLLAILALRHRRNELAVLAVVGAALCSPLAGAFAALACLACALDRRAQLFGFLVAPRPGGRSAILGRILGHRLEARPAPPGPLAALAAALAALAVIGGLALAFPNSGPFPYPATGLVLTLLFCAVAVIPLVPMPSVLRWGAVLYALAAVTSFTVPNEVGGNAIRLAQSAGVPLLLAVVTLGNRPDHLAATRPRRHGRWKMTLRTAVALVVVGGFATWQWAPGLGVLKAPQMASAAAASFYQPLLHQIERRSSGPVRVEAVPTINHWESAYLAPTVSLARGWERQLDVADNPLFYRPGPLRASTYLAWLRANGVSWVALPHTRLDYASRAEAALLRRRRVPGLTKVWSSPHWQLWHVGASPGLLSGPGRLLALDPDHLSLSVTRPAVLTVRVRYTDLWTRPDGSGPALDCVRPSPGAWTEVVARRPGTLRLRISMFGDRPATCPGS